MVTWRSFVDEAPTVSEVFRRRHAATGKLCLLATLRADGFPRISPIEPRVFEDQLTLVGMPGTTKFADLQRDPRFNLHTATVDSQLGDGDAKLAGPGTCPTLGCTRVSPTTCSRKSDSIYGDRSSNRSSSPT